MGNVTFGIPEDLAISLRDALGINLFIETGTYKGGTSLWASRNFKEVITIEIDPERFNKTKSAISNMKDTDNIIFANGNSKDVLKHYLDMTEETVLFWLDAHGLYNGNMTPEDEIPLLPELEIIFDWMKKTKQECVILIDDARLFLEPPPTSKGYHPEYWPSMGEIKEFIYSKSDYQIRVTKDVIVVVPERLQNIVDDWSIK